METDIHFDGYYRDDKTGYRDSDKGDEFDEGDSVKRNGYEIMTKIVMQGS